MTEIVSRTPVAAATRQQASALWLALAMTLFVASYERWVLGFPYADYFVDLFTRHSVVGALPRVAGVAAVCTAQVLFFWASFASSRPWRVVYLAGFAFVTFVEYGYISATGTFVTPVDIRVAFENLARWRAMASIGIDWRAACPVVVYGLLLVGTPPGRGQHFRRAVAVLMVTLAIQSVYAAAGFLGRSTYADIMMTNQAYVTGSAQAFARAVTMLGWDDLADRLASHQRTVLSYRSAHAPSTNLVLVIDEAVRGDHLSLNGYRRPTTPWLDSLQAANRLTNWGIAASSATESDPSILSLLTGVDLPDPERRSMSQPTIFQFAKAMNFNVHLFDGQIDRPRFGLTLKDLHYVDDYRGAKFFGDDPDTDFRIADAVRRVLESSTGQFVIVLKRGDHIPYYNNYPLAEGVWARTRGKGTLIGRYIPANWADWVDSYDDGIRYNLDRFFSGLLGEAGTLPRTVVLYTSDHGQPYDPTTDTDFRTAATVPLLMFGDARPPVDTGYQASHRNIFATLLDLMAFPDAERAFPYGRSLLKARASDHDTRHVFLGESYGRSPFVLKDFDALKPAPRVE